MKTLLTVSIALASILVFHTITVAQPADDTITTSMMVGSWEGFSNQGNFIRMTNLVGADGSVQGHATVVSSSGVVLFDQDVGLVTLTPVADNEANLTLQFLPGDISVQVYNVGAIRVTNPQGEVIVMGRVDDPTVAYQVPLGMSLTEDSPDIPQPPEIPEVPTTNPPTDVLEPPTPNME